MSSKKSPRITTNGHSQLNSSASNNGQAKLKEAPATTPVEEELHPDATSEAQDSEGTATAIEDPVRMYLMQMGEIPMLSRDKEVSFAKRIEKTRNHFRRTMLCNDFVLHGAAQLLQKVADGELRLDRTIEIF